MAKYLHRSYMHSFNTLNYLCTAYNAYYNINALNIVVILFRDKEKVCTCLVQTQYFLNIFDPQLVESEDVEPTDMES
jgi:hypothetical protein